MYHLYSAYKTVTDSVTNIKKTFRENKPIIFKAFNTASLYLKKSKIYQTLNLSHDFIHYKNRSNCSISIFNKCLKKHPLQLTSLDVKTIQEYCYHKTYKNWQAISIYWQMVRDKKLFCSKTTFYRYANKLGIIFTKKRHQWKNYSSIIATKPFEILHMDVTKIVLNNLKGYLYIIIDNYSRSILAYEFSKEIKSYISTKNLIKACRKHNLQVNPYITLITDGGSENKGYVNRFINLPCVNIVKKIAQTDITSSNSLVESVIKQLKQYHLQINSEDDFEKVSNAIDFGIQEYEDKPLDVHKGYSPNEVRDLHQNYQDKIPFFSTEERKLVVENRKKINQINRCGTCK